MKLGTKITMKALLPLLLCALFGAHDARAQASVKPPAAAPAKFEELARTPQMGWNTWNTFACDINEKLIKEAADAMVSSGMREAGYVYLNIDDCWHGGRDAKGFIQADPVRFPSGMKALADYAHARGLKLGLYSDAGAHTCAGRPGSRGHEYQDALTYAEWGIDYLKYDWCETEGLNAKGAYTTMRDALRRAGRPILFSLCEWGNNKPWEWGKEVGHSWRTTGDIYPCWDCELNRGTWASLGVLPILDKQAGLRNFSGPGHWNDMDMLEVGKGMSEDEDKAHFSIWAMMNSPLIAGNDIRSMSAATRKILTHRGIIALNQDERGIQAWRFLNDGKLEMYGKPLSGGEWAVMFLNRDDKPRKYTFDWNAYEIKDEVTHNQVDFGKQRHRFTELWSGATGDTAKPFAMTVPAHGVLVLRLVPQ
jgi:alpha-galactosidase